jgi:DNA repair exonuclease SbcCD ATPase subunit
VLWLRALTEPPPFLHEDDWPLIEHIRATGQLASGSMVPTDAWFDRPIHEGKVAAIADGNAAERTASFEKAWRDQLAMRKARREAFEAFEVARRKAKDERIKRAREQWEMAQALRAHEDEAKQLRAERKAEQKRRDQEWEAETERRQAAAYQLRMEQENTAAAQRARAQRAELDKQLAGMRQRFHILMQATTDGPDRLTRIKSHIMEVARTSQLFGFKQMKVAEMVALLGCSEHELELCCYELGLSYVQDN